MLNQPLLTDDSASSRAIKIELNATNNYTTENEKNLDILYLHPHENLIYDIFNQTTADIIMRIVFHKIFSISVGITALFGIGMVVVSSATDLIRHTTQYWFIMYSLTVILLAYAIIVLLSINKTIFSRTLFTFDFMMKACNASRLVICRYIVSYHTMGNTDSDHDPDNLVLKGIMDFLFVIVFSVIDGLQWPIKIKISLVIINALYFSFSAFLYTFYWSFSDYEVELSFLFWNKIKLDLHSWIKHSTIIIAIFLCKQTFRLIYTRNKSTSTTLSKDIQISWIL
eukprot:353469_1